MNSILAHGRTALVSIPFSYDAKNRYPVLYSFHGGGSNPQDHLAMTSLATACDQAGIVLVAPYGTAHDAIGSIRTWNALDCCGVAKEMNVDELAFFHELRAKVDKLYRPSATILNGFSNGAMLAYRLATESPTKIDGVCGVSGTVPRSLLGKPPRNHAGKDGQMRLLHIHGQLDRSMPFDGGVGVSGQFDAVGALETVDYFRPGFSISQPIALPLVNVDAGAARLWWYDMQTSLVVLPEGGHTWPGGQMPLNPASRQPYTEAEVGKLVREFDATDLLVKFVLQGSD